MPKGHPPTPQAKKYHIAGAPGNSRTMAKKARSSFNDELRTQRCVKCLYPRAKGSYPICPNCRS